MKIHQVAKIALLLFLVELSHASLNHHREDPDNNIIGGRPAEIREFPYQVSIQFLEEHNCGGSIITPKHILTAAHCFDDITEEETLIRAGSSIILQGGNLVKVKKINSHPNFIAIAYDYDIAVVELEEALTYSENISAIELPALNSTSFANSIGTLTGWGSTDPDSFDMSTQLMTVNVPIVSRQECSEDYPKDHIYERQICAGTRKGGKDSCLGDSGGPLVVNGVQVGIVSWGRRCAAANQPGVYTKVAESEMRTFIKEKAGI